MKDKLKRLSRAQLQVLAFFFKNEGKIVTIQEMMKYTPLEGKSLGGVLSSLARTKVGEGQLIEPLGKAEKGGLRWRLNEKLQDIQAMQKEVSKLLLTYEL